MTASSLGLVGSRRWWSRDAYADASSDGQDALEVFWLTLQGHREHPHLFSHRARGAGSVASN